MSAKLTKGGGDWLFPLAIDILKNENFLGRGAYYVPAMSDPVPCPAGEDKPRPCYVVPSAAKNPAPAARSVEHCSAFSLRRPMVGATERRSPFTVGAVHERPAMSNPLPCPPSSRGRREKTRNNEKGGDGYPPVCPLRVQPAPFRQGGHVFVRPGPCPRDVRRPSPTREASSLAVGARITRPPCRTL